MPRKLLAICWITFLWFFGLAGICAQAQFSHIPDSSYGGNDRRWPRATYSPPPDYSERARKAGYEGICVLQLRVDEEGLLQDVTVVRQLGMGLDEKAVEAVRKWTFDPATKDGAPIAAKVSVEVSFHLYGENGGKNTLFGKANRGEVKAQFEASQILLSDPELPKDKSNPGFPYLEKAANQGLPQAQFAMGEYFASYGNDLVAGYAWYALAQRKHYKDSGRRIDDLAAKMSPEQIAEARRRVEGNSP